MPNHNSADYSKPELQGVRYGLRTLRRNPGFAVVAVATLALGIGANAAIFSLLDAVMLEMLPVCRPEQLVELLTVRTGEPFNAFSYQALEHFRTHNQVLSGFIASTRLNATLPTRNWTRLRG